MKGYPFEVQMPPGGQVKGVILADHLKSVDWRARRAKRIERLPMETLTQTLKKAALLLTAG